MRSKEPQPLCTIVGLSPQRALELCASMFRVIGASSLAERPLEQWLVIGYIGTVTTCAAHEFVPAFVSLDEGQQRRCR